MSKKTARLRRAVKTRAKIRELEMPRLSVYRSSAHVYAQVIGAAGKVVVTASTVDKELKASLTGHSGNIAAATVVGKAIAERAIKAGISKVAFDRSGFKYHGVVKALAEAAREAGLEF